MSANLFDGKLVRLAANDPEELAKTEVSWARDSELFRLFDSEAQHLWSEKKVKEWYEKDLDKEEFDNFGFSIQTLEDHKLIGFMGLFDLYWNHGDTLVGISIGEKDYLGKGYGTDAMQTMLRYVFMELNLRRVSLLVFEYNPRAIRSYEKCGFVMEGRIRGAMLREGRRWDWLMMGVMKEDWLQAQNLEVHA